MTRLPSANKACPVSERHRVNARFGPALGDGPVYPSGFSATAVMRLAPARNFNSSKWGGNKVLWLRRPGIRGDVLIRGRRLDAQGEVRFNRGDIPAAAMRIPDPHARGWTATASYTRVRSPGCYAYTIRGRGFRDVVTFRATR